MFSSPFLRLGFPTFHEFQLVYVASLFWCTFSPQSSSLTKLFPVQDFSLTSNSLYFSYLLWVLVSFFLLIVCLCFTCYFQPIFFFMGFSFNLTFRLYLCFYFQVRSYSFCCLPLVAYFIASKPSNLGIEFHKAW